MPSGPASPVGEQRVISFREAELLENILWELRAIKALLCKMDGQAEFSDFDATQFNDVNMPSQFQGS